MNKKIILLLITLMALVSLSSLSQGAEEGFDPAPDFTAATLDGRIFSLDKQQGNITILHVQNFENPICIECEKELRGQIEALADLAAKNQRNLTIVTLNLRQNSASENGQTLAERWYGINVTWYWIEEEAPFQIASNYQKYWTVSGAFANPSLVLIDMNQSIVGVYHIYLMGKGLVDGIRSAASLQMDAEDILEGRWEGFKGQVYDERITFLAIFALGVLTALSPCSIALLVAMISYVGSLQKDSKDKPKKISFQGIWIGVVFTVGMALVFFVFGLFISYLGFFIEASALFYLIAGVILVILGVNVFTPLRQLLRRKTKKESASPQLIKKGQNVFFRLSKKSIYLGAFFLGVLFAIGWAPCALGLMMPVFILMLTQDITLLMGGLLLFVFGLGHGVPIIPLCAVTNTVRGKLGNKYVTAGRWMQRIFGVLIIGVGVIMAIRFWGINLW